MNSLKMLCNHVALYSTSHSLRECPHLENCSLTIQSTVKRVLISKTSESHLKQMSYVEVNWQ